MASTGWEGKASADISQGREGGGRWGCSFSEWKHVNVCVFCCTSTQPHANNNDPGERTREGTASERGEHRKSPHILWHFYCAGGFPNFHLETALAIMAYYAKTNLPLQTIVKKKTFRWNSSGELSSHNCIKMFESILMALAKVILPVQKAPREI